MFGEKTTGHRGRERERERGGREGGKEGRKRGERERGGTRNLTNLLLNDKWQRCIGECVDGHTTLHINNDLIGGFDR